MFLIGSEYVFLLFFLKNLLFLNSHSEIINRITDDKVTD